MIEWTTAFVGGLLGSAHCIGMCGGFVVLVGADKARSPSPLARQLIYAAGRLFTYVFLGALAGYAGSTLAGSDGLIADLQRVFSIGAGVIMILVGLSTMGLFSIQRLLPKQLGCNAASVFRGLLKSPGLAGVFLAGTANGFLPCGLVYAFVAMAVASGSATSGMLIMLLFGLGTIPALTLVGCGSTFVSCKLRHYALRVAAVVVIATGILCVYRAWPTGSCCDGAEHLTVATNHIAP